VSGYVNIKFLDNTEFTSYSSIRTVELDQFPLLK
jgi:hypothetical protein